MSVAGIAGYLAWAGIYAGFAGGAVLGAWRLAGGRPPAAAVGLVLSVAFVVFLGLSPFPAPGDVVCKTPRLMPFNFIGVYRNLLAAEAPLGTWLTSPGALSPVMNVVFFALPGIFLARLGAGWRRIAAAAVLLTAAIETTQLTGLWGVYPCPYRHFDTDDLLLNTLGVLLGAGLARRFMRAPRSPG